MSTWGPTTAAPAPRAGTVEVLVGLLAELDQATESGVFYDRVCQAVVTLTTMKRAVLLLHDETYRSVIPVGSCGVDTERLKRVGGTLDETPIAQIALEEDRVGTERVRATRRRRTVRLLHGLSLVVAEAV